MEPNFTPGGPSGVGYNVGPQVLDWQKMFGQLAPQQQQQGQQPGQPLNIQSAAQQGQGPSWMDRLRQFFQPGQAQAAPMAQGRPGWPGGIAPQLPPDAPVATPTASQPAGLTPESMDEYLINRFGAPGTYPTMPQRNMGGPVYAPRLMQFGPGYTAGGSIV